MGIWSERGAPEGGKLQPFTCAATHWASLASAEDAFADETEPAGSTEALTETTWVVLSEVSQHA